MSDMSPHAILAQVAADVAEYRDQATEHARTAAGLAEQMEKPGALLTRMADEEADLARKLEALRNEMVDIRRAYDALDEERRHHAKASEAKRALADGFEQVAADVAVRLDVQPPKRVPRDGNGRIIPPPGEVEIVSGPVSATLHQDNGLPMIWSDAAAPGGYVCAVPAPPDGPGVDLPAGRRVCGQPVESEPCSGHGPDDVPPIDPAAPVPGTVVARQGPGRPMPDGRFQPPAAEPNGKGRHKKAKGPRFGRGHADEQAAEQDGDGRG